MSLFLSLGNDNGCLGANLLVPIYSTTTLGPSPKPFFFFLSFEICLLLYANYFILNPYHVLHSLEMIYTPPFPGPCERDHGGPTLT